MKDFVKTMLAVVCGYIVLRIIGFLFFMILIGSALATGGGSVSLPRRGVLDMDLSAFTIAEQTQDMTASTSSLFSGNMLPAVGLRDAVEAIKVAA